MLPIMPPSMLLAVMIMNTQESFIYYARRYTSTPCFFGYLTIKYSVYDGAHRVGINRLSHKKLYHFVFFAITFEYKSINKATGI